MFSVYSRHNEATRALISNNLYASGTCKNVWRGVYTRGPRAGQACVAKEFRSGSVFEDRYFAEELNIVRRTQSIVDRWHAAGVIRGVIVLNNPEVWEFTRASGGQKTLVEPYIEGFEKFNSNTGWAPVTRTQWGEAMQALSHFSYHDSGGQFLLCDLQGGPYSGGYILSDPVIMSEHYDCGPGDLGPNGIRAFFARHRCGRFCNPRWIKPPPVPSSQVKFSKRKGTTMVSRVAVTRRRGRPSRTRSAK